MRRRFVAVCDYPGNLGFEQGNALAQFMVRIAVERLCGQQAGQIAFAARALVKFHHVALCDRFRLAVNRLQR